MTIFSFNSLNTYSFRFLNIFIIISLKSLLNPTSGPSWGQFLLTLDTLLWLSLLWVTFPCCCFYICRNFRLFNGHCGWYIVEALDSVICLTSGIYFTLNSVAASLWKALGGLPLYMCIPALSQRFTGDLPHRFLPPTHTAASSPVPWPVDCSCFRALSSDLCLFHTASQPYSARTPACCAVVGKLFPSRKPKWFGAHLMSSPSLKDHCDVLPIIQYLRMVAHIFLSSFIVVYGKKANLVPRIIS